MKRKYIMAILSLTFVAMTLVTGCSSQKAADTSETKEESGVESTKEQEEVAYSQILKASMEKLTSENRGAGLDGEKNQIEELKKRMESRGYQVELQAFHGQTLMGEQFDTSNVISKKKAAKGEQAPILVLSSHIDSIASTTGANDNASGVAAMEAIADQLQKTDSNLEIWFVAFSGEEEGLLGSRAFLEQLQEEDKQRIIGDLQMDMLGNRLSQGYDIDTTTGTENYLATALLEAAEEILGDKLSVNQEKSSDHVPFAVAGIPSVMFTQHGDGYENHEILDDMSQIDMKKLEEGTRIVGKAVQNLIEQDNDALWNTSEDNTKDITGYLNPYTEVLDMDTSLNGMENNLGIGFHFLGTVNDEILGEVKTYEAKVRWLNMDQPIDSEFDFYEDQFQQGWIKAAESGYTSEEMQKILTDFIGEPIENEKDGGLSHFWGWSTGRTAFQLDEDTDGKYTLSVTCYNNMAEEISEIAIGDDGQAFGQLENSQKKIWDDVITKIISEKDRAAYMDKIVFFTDGVRYKLGYTNPAEPDNENNTMFLDLTDALMENGEYRHFYKTVATVIHEYGHVLGMNRDQVDVQQNGEDSNSLPPYKEDSYMKAFMEQFYPDQEVNDGLANENHRYFDHSDEYVSLYASDKTMEDFAESFMCFVLSEKQTDNSIAREKINFFWNYPELVERRDTIRENFHWIL